MRLNQKPVDLDAVSTTANINTKSHLQTQNKNSDNNKKLLGKKKKGKKAKIVKNIGSKQSLKILKTKLYQN